MLSNAVSFNSVLLKHPGIKYLLGSIRAGENKWHFSGISKTLLSDLIIPFLSEYLKSSILETKSSLHKVLGCDVKYSKFCEEVDGVLRRVNSVSEIGEYSIMGDTVTLAPYGYDGWIRVSFWGDSIEEMVLIDSDSSKIQHNLVDVVLVDDPDAVVYGSRLPFHEHILSQDGALIEMGFSSPPSFHGNLELLKMYISKMIAQGYDIWFSSNHLGRLQESLEREYPVIVPTLGRGGVSNQLKVIVLTDLEIFDSISIATTRKKTPDELFEIKDIDVGEYIVHRNHGVAIYSGIKEIEVNGTQDEYLVLSYSKGDKLYVPLSQAPEYLTKYVGTGRRPRLTRLGGQDWERIQTRVKRSVSLIARDLLELYAKRQMKKGYRYSKTNNWLAELIESFEYKETDDQLRVWSEIENDMESDRVMDRIIVGDVGFGKTELAIRSAFKAVQDGKQVAILAPTTVLVEQHYAVLKDRLKPFPVDVRKMSRMVDKAGLIDNIGRLKSGVTDIVVGTHRLLSSDVGFKDLGLLIVDEEQRFGVKQKEKIKQLKEEVDVLSLSATPIPRSLNMALSGVRDISVLLDPPEGRLSIKTLLEVYSKQKIADVIKKEIDRGGQVYVIHNRVRTINSFAEELRAVLGDTRLTVAHGQMTPEILAKTIGDFHAGKYDVLLSTTIIENGIDMPNVNTIIIDNAQNFGLGQLHQLRGRVGRSNVQSYCYLFYPKEMELNEISKERLETIRDSQELGAGFKIATRDLEIRGAGNLLGEDQSGNIFAVGYSLYVQLLREQVRQMKSALDS